MIHCNILRKYKHTIHNDKVELTIEYTILEITCFIFNMKQVGLYLHENS